MKTTRRTLLAFGALAAFGVAAACSRDGGTGPATANGARVLMRLAAGSSSTALGGVAGAATSILTGDFGGGNSGYGDFGDGMGHHWRGWWGWTRTRDVDSLIVTVTKVQVLTALSDSENAVDSVADSLAADSAHHGDDDDAHDFEQREFGWTDLAVAGSGHLDLVHLPDSTSAGLPVAAGTLPAGSYRHVRLFVTNPLIYFDSLIVTPAGDSLKPDTGYTVTFPSADSTGAIFKTDDPFVVAAAGDTVQMVFDRDDTVRHIIITGDGKIIVPPTFRFHFWR